MFAPKTKVKGIIGDTRKPLFIVKPMIECHAKLEIELEVSPFMLVSGSNMKRCKKSNCKKSHIVSTHLKET